MHRLDGYLELSGSQDEITMSGGANARLVSFIVIAGIARVVFSYPKGSPTTKKATSIMSARDKISSLALSTMSRSATMTGRS